MAYRRELPNRFDPMKYYLAQIAACCLAPWSSKSVSVNEMLLHFRMGAEDMQVEKAVDAEKSKALEKSMASKSIWMAGLGLQSDGTPLKV